MTTLGGNLQNQIGAYQKIQKDYDNAVSNRTQLESQLKENEQVNHEFTLLNDDSIVYKMIGPCLVKQDRTEAVSNVQKRIEFIQTEIKRSETLISDLQTKLDAKKMEVVKLETQYQQQLAAQAK
ncbi:Prefoldin [Globomyces pollinis-pini]|nr:Prefoldin [Globomyces pollinis-pini]KAJ2997149.1 hypothetical protein HDV02_005828 [Globomyces sp. JEL0801]